MISTVASILGSNLTIPSWITCSFSFTHSHYNSLVSCSPRILLFPSLFDLGEHKEIATTGPPFAGHYPVIVSPLLSVIPFIITKVSFFSFLYFFFRGSKVILKRVDKVGINTCNAYQRGTR